MAPSITLLVDSRERALFDHFDTIPGTDTFVRKEQITTGDYALITNDSVLEIFERKSLRDYADSFKDGRHENKNKLMSMRDKTGCLIYYIVEGRRPDKMSDKINGIPYSSIEASMFNMMSNHGIFVIRTDSAEDTARMLVAKRTALINSMKNGKFSLKISIDDPIAIMTERPTITCDTIILDMFSSIPGVSDTTAKELAKTISISEVIFCDSDAITSKLSDIKVNGRKLSCNVIKKITSLDTEDKSNIFKAIPGIKDTTAFDDIFEEELAHDSNELCTCLIGKYGDKRISKIKRILAHQFGS